MLSLSQIIPGSIEYSLVKVMSVKEISKSKSNAYFQSIQGADETAQVIITVFSKDQSDFIVLKQGDILYFQGKFVQSPFGNRLQASVQSDSMVQVVTDLNLFLNNHPNLDSIEFKNRFKSLERLGTVENVSRLREFKTLNNVEKNKFFDLYGLVIYKSKRKDD